MSIYKGNSLIAGGRQCMPLLSFMWADHILNDASWLRADTFSWQSGAVYQAAYEHLVNDYYSSATSTDYYAWKDNGGVVVYTNTATPDTSSSVYDSPGHALSRTAITAYTSTTITVEQHEGTYSGIYTRYSAGDVGTPVSQTETIAGTTITYYLAADGHKIVLADQESNVAAIYTATGVAWYYIIDTVNTRFKLPRSKHEHYGDRPVVGNGMTLGLTDGTHLAGIGTSSSSGSNSGYANIYGQNVGTTVSGSHNLTNNKSVGLTTDSKKSGIISTPVQDTDQYKYLYFYVGNFTQTAVENTAGLNAELFNGKVDVGHQVTEFQEPTSANNYTWYRKYADGWVEQGGYVGSNTSTVTLLVPMNSSDYTLVGISNSDQNRILNLRNKTTSNFVSANYNSGSASGFSWQVSGMAA